MLVSGIRDKVARQLLCTGIANGDGHPSLVQAKQRVARVLLKKHTCFDTLLFQSLIWPPGWSKCLLGGSWVLMDAPGVPLDASWMVLGASHVPSDPSQVVSIRIPQPTLICGIHKIQK